MRFEIVDDALRTDEDEELNEALFSGRTVFLPGADNNRINTLYSRLKKRGRFLRRRAHAKGGQDGFIIWLDPEEASE